MPKDDRNSPLDKLFQVEQNIENFRADLIGKAIESFEKNRAQLVNYHRMVAQMRKIQYDALIEAGFAEPQAMFLLTQPNNSQESDD